MLAVLGFMVSVSVVPGFNQSVAHRTGSCLIGSEVIEVEPRSCKSVLNMIDNRSLDRTLICADVAFHEVPQLLLLF